jgi:xyloglucan galactosyltransferase MUR3
MTMNITLFLFAFCMSLHLHVAQYFYIYEWPEELQDVYPTPGNELHPKAAYSHDFYDNNGAGKMIDGDSGMFTTWQFSLFKNLMNRLRVSKFRTLDPAKASAFIIPYDGGVHSFIDHKNGKDRLASPYGWKAVELLTKASKQPDLFWKRNGHDHFVIFSVTCYHMVGIGTKSFFQNICQNCSVLSIETTAAGLPIYGRNKKRWYALPYPSSYHYWEGLKSEPWRPRGDRHTLAIFIGSVHTSNAVSNHLRQSLFSQCSDAPSTDCRWFETAHSDKGVLNHSDALQLYQASTFCLAPSGDSLTRKSLFDSYLSGCIPVLFAAATLQLYSWHLSQADIRDTTVLISKPGVIDGSVNFIQVLRDVPPSVVRTMQEKIAKLAFRLQYSVVPPQHLEHGGVREGEVNTWSPPSEDAADIAVAHILSPATIEPLDGFSEEELKDGQKRQRYIMAQSVDYMGAGGGGSPNMEGAVVGRKKGDRVGGMVGMRGGAGGAAGGKKRGKGVVEE